MTMSLILRTPLWLQTLLGLIIGVGAGLYFGKEGQIVFDLFGDSFVALIKMIVIPLVFFSILSSVGGLGGSAGINGRLGLVLLTIFGFMLTALLSSSIGILIGHYFQPGLGVSGLSLASFKPKIIPSPLEVFQGLIPTNVPKAFVEGKILSILLFGLLLGVAIAHLRERADGLRKVLSQITDALFMLTRGVLRLTPLGVFGLMGGLVATQGLEVLRPLLPYMGLIYLGCFAVLFGLYPLLLGLFGLRILPFYKLSFPAQQTAFFTCSSLGTLPVSLDVVANRLKVDRAYGQVATALGANMKMDGCGAIYPAITAIFIANIYQIDLSLSHYGVIILTSALGSLATAGVPSAAVVMLSLTLSAVGLPLEAIALVAGIDRIIDMIRTATNVTGQILVPTLMARLSGLLAQDSPLRRGRVHS